MRRRLADVDPDLVRALTRAVLTLRVVVSGGTDGLAPATVVRMRLGVGVHARSADALELDDRRRRLDAVLDGTGLRVDEVLKVAQLDDAIAARLRSLLGRRTPKRERPRCGARTRTGAPCQARAAWDDELDRPRTRRGRCRMHGGTSTGPRTEAGRAAALAAGCRNLARVNAQRRSDAAIAAGHHDPLRAAS